jgi:MoaA/NifB/PqqE/SkfB family radical SAM enzyme
VCAARVADLAQLVDDPHAVDATTALHRLTVFVTYRCNLRCAYCKTIVRDARDLRALPQRAVTFGLAEFERMLDGHGATPIQHLHFTGGEASLLRDLPAMVRAAKARGVGCVSLTTNGTQPPAVYEELVCAGVDEVRVSLDDAHAAGGRGGKVQPAIVQPALIQPAWGAAIATVRALGAMRRGGAPFFLILNTVVESRNRADVPDLVRFLLGLGPDDIKLITSVDERNELGAFPGAGDLVARLHAILAEHPPERFPLLRRKVATVFAPLSIGLEAASPAPDGSWRCYVPLTERTVDGVHYYPCSVYVREGGRPLGSIDEPQDLQRIQTAAFVARGDCRSDPICARYCLHCTREFNQQANEARRAAGARA